MTNERIGGVGPLTGLRVVDATAGFGAYAARLFSDLGADVIRIEPPLDRDAPARGEPDFHGRFVNAGKRLLTLDLAQDSGIEVFHRLLAASDVLVESFVPTWADSRGLDPEALSWRHRQLVHVSITPYGRSQTDSTVVDDDIAVLAAGGLLHLGGYPDAGPIAAFGQQSDMAGSLFAAVGGMVALLDRERMGRGRWVDVSVQECVAQAVEDSVATYDLTGVIRERLGSDPREAGSGIYRCADGYVTMVAGRLGTAKAWNALVEWMVAEGVDGATDLTAAEWGTLTHRQRPESIQRFGDIFGRFIADRTRQEMYRDAQGRGIALSPVNDIAAVLLDPQLAARDFFVEVDDEQSRGPVTFPGPPYRLSLTPAAPARPARATASVDDGLAPDPTWPSAVVGKRSSAP